MLEKARKEQKEKDQLTALFAAADSDGSGTVNREEFEVIVHRPEVQHMLSILEGSVADAEKLFSHLAAEDGIISQEEFIEGVVHCRGGAKALDMLIMTAL